MPSEAGQRGLAETPSTGRRLSAPVASPTRRQAHSPAAASRWLDCQWRVLVEEHEPGAWLVRTATVVPDNERWQHEPQAAAQLQAAMAWSIVNPAASEVKSDVTCNITNPDVAPDPCCRAEYAAPQSCRFAHGYGRPTDGAPCGLGEPHGGWQYPRPILAAYGNPRRSDQMQALSARCVAPFHKLAPDACQTARPSSAIC